MKVYVKAGETINVGSSVQGLGAGTINLRAPNGSYLYQRHFNNSGFYCQPHSGSSRSAAQCRRVYTLYIHTVLAAEEGVWEIDFVSQNNGLPGGENPVPVPAIRQLDTAFGPIHYRF
jgi:hypothetical protein